MKASFHQCAQNRPLKPLVIARISKKEEKKTERMTFNKQELIDQTQKKWTWRAE